MARLDKLHAEKLSKPALPSHAIDPLEESIIARPQINLVIRIGLTLILCEVMVVTIIYLLPELQAGVKVLLDAVLLILLLAPILYFTVIRPMVRQILERRRAEEQLKRHGDDLESLVNQRTAELSAANQTLKQQIRVRTTAENLMRERTFQLDDYIRELQCLYAISRLMEKPEISIEDLVTKTIGLIPFAWLDPEAIGVRVTLDEREFKTENFKETERKQSGRIMVHGQCCGLLEVVYLKDIPETDTEPYPKR